MLHSNLGCQISLRKTSGPCSCKCILRSCLTRPFLASIIFPTPISRQSSQLPEHLSFTRYGSNRFVSMLVVGKNSIQFKASRTGCLLSVIKQRLPSNCQSFVQPYMQRLNVAIQQLWSQPYTFLIHFVVNIFNLLFAGCIARRRVVKRIETKIYVFLYYTYIFMPIEKHKYIYICLQNYIYMCVQYCVHYMPTEIYTYICILICKYIYICLQIYIYNYMN